MTNFKRAAHEHLEAFMAQDVEKIRQTTHFPFVHIQPDGEFLSFASAEELAAFGDLPFKTEIVECDLLDAGEDSAILAVVAQRSNLDGVLTIRVKAVWGATKSENGWRIRWRHFLGEV
ncbi:MAG: hypothetical protein AB8C02_13515 [Halioglobus sp.]